MAASKKKTNVVPDRIDLRDRIYQPHVATVPKADLPSRDTKLPEVRSQGQTSACTGFATAAAIEFLYMSSQRTDPSARVSPYMLYSMARRYDEFPGSTQDEGSSIRGALKGWYKHGACRDDLWRGFDMPKPKVDPELDWWPDAVQRPMGAYYRLDTRSVVDMQVALCEVGVLIASATCHAGWDEGYDLTAAVLDQQRYWPIPHRTVGADDMGHAFALVGYNEHGFLVLNSWGKDWGSKGLAILTYEDWLDNAMDCWVAQLGVRTHQHSQIAAAPSLRVHGGRVALASERTLRNREIGPFVVDVENNGVLSRAGDFRTTPEDLTALVDIHLELARTRWGLDDGVVDVAIFAHGGLVGEEAAAESAAVWVPALYSAKIFPVFIMWETDLWSTIKNRLLDLVRGQPKPQGGLGEALEKWWNTRVESAVRRPGQWLWTEMKQNAKAMSENPESGVMKLAEIVRSRGLLDGGPNAKVRLHLIGHSAGAIAHSHLAANLLEAHEQARIESINFMAPAVTADSFKELVLPHVGGRIGRYHQFHLTDAMEDKDDTCRPILGYGRSLLYLVSQAFEEVRGTPILGMEKFWDSDAALTRPNVVRGWAAPSGISSATTHGAFGDKGDKTVDSVIKLIKSQGL